MKTKINVFLILGVLISSLTASPVLAAPSTIKPFLAQSASIYADNIIWKYKMIDGILYCRQYNESTNTWIGEWEPC